MVILRTIKELTADLGILEVEKDAFREDVFLYLEEHTGSLAGTLNLPVPEIQKLSKRFIDSDKGTLYFARRGTSNQWSHGTTREDVERALPDIIRRWVKNKKDTMQKSNAASHAALIQPDTTMRSSRHDHILSRTSSTSTFQPSEDEDQMPGASSSVFLDEAEVDTNCLPDIHHDGQTDTSSLPDIADVVRGRGKLPRPARRQRSWSASPEPEVISIRLSDDEVPLHMLAKKRPLPKTPQQPSGLGLLSPPLTSPKFRNTGVSGKNRSYEVAAAEDGNSNNNKKARHSYEQLPGPTIGSAIPPAPVHETAHAGPEFQTVSGRQGSMMVEANAKSAPRTVVNLQRPSVCLVALSTTIPHATVLRLHQDALSDIPATVLDYVRTCEKTSLSRANAKDINESDRRKCQDRCKLFRDLYTDLESRILALACLESNGEGCKERCLAKADQSLTDICSFSLWE